MIRPRPVLLLQRELLRWINAPVADDELRLLLWMHVREAFSLPALTFCTLRSARTAADDVAAAALRSVQPNLIGKAKTLVQRDAESRPPES
jgi:hypothetical protein